jgi:hypothetical protein
MRSSRLNDIVVTGGTLTLNAGSATVQAKTNLTANANSGVTASGSIALHVGDQMILNAGSLIEAGASLDMTLDLASSGEVDDLTGGVMQVFGRLKATQITMTSGEKADVIEITPQSIRGDVTVLLGAGEDHLTLTALNARPNEESFVIDGQAAADEFVVNRNALAVSYILTFADTGAANDGADFLTINGRDTALSTPDALAVDVILLRRNFVALLNETAGVTAPDFERINYDGIDQWARDDQWFGRRRSVLF